MGQIEVSGSASKEIQYDLMRIVLEFRGDADSPSEASETVMRESEDFLTVLKERGFDISKIVISEDKINRERTYSDDGHVYYHNLAERRLEILSGFNMKFINDVRAIIQKKNYQVGFKVSFAFSKARKVQEELLIEALKNAKAQAELMAQAIDSRIIGLVSADKNMPKAVKDEMYDGLCSVLCTGLAEDTYESYENSDEIAPTTTIMSETIYTVWQTIDGK